MDKTKLLEIFNKIKDYNKIIIFPHARPDGDCIGTSFGLKNIIETSWPDKTVIVAGETSDFTSFLGRPETLKDEDFKGALAISVDTANEERIAEQRYKLCDELIKIPLEGKIESLNVSVACGTILYEILRQKKFNS